MSIKLLSTNELEVVKDLAYLIWPNTFENILSTDQITYMLEWMYNLETLQKQSKEGHLFYLYSENDQPLGFIGIEPNYSLEDVLKIHKIYVLPQTQGLGIGKKLIQKAIDVAKESGIFKIVLNVNRFNKAVTFYKHLGFKLDYEENIEIGKGFLMEDYVMSLTLDD